MKKNYKQLLLVLYWAIGGILGIQYQVQAQGVGFTVSSPTMTENGLYTIFVWKVEQTTSPTGLSHFNIQNFCLPTGSDILTENSSDNLNWTTISNTTSDGSSVDCQTFGAILKFSGALNSKINYYRLTVKGKYTLVDGQSIVKYGKGQSEISCQVVSTQVPKLASQFAAAVQKQVCEGGSLTLNAATGHTNYAWSLNGTDLNVHTNAFSISNAAPGTYSYQVAYEISNCETMTETFTVTVSAKPVITLQTAGFCAMGSTSLAALISSERKDGAWSIVSGSATISDGQLVSSSPGEITLKYTVPFGDGCFHSAETKVSVWALPTVTATADQTVCYDTEITLNGAGAISYLWDNEVLDGVSFNANSTTTYTVIGTDGNGCTNKATSKVTVNALPTVTATADQTVCYDDKVTLKGSGASTYVWDNGVVDGELFFAKSTTTYTVIGTDGNGCTNKATSKVTVNALPTVTATADQSVCYDTEITLNGSGALSYIWDNDIPNNTSFKVKKTTTYTVTGTDSNGCENTATSTVTVHELPTVVANAVANEVCEGSTVTLFGTGASNYTWDKGVFDNVAFTQSVGAVTYTVTGIDDHLCRNSNTITIQVKALPLITVSENQSICIGDSIAIQASGNATSYLWSPGNGSTAEISVSPLTTTTYVVTGSLDGCTASGSSLVTVKPRPSVNLTVDNATICLGDKVILQATSSSGAVFQWSNSTVTQALLEDFPTANKTYVVTASLDGCTSATSASVEVEVIECKLFTTYTQGFYGNTGGLTCDGMTTIAKLKSALSSGSITFGGSNNRSFTLRATDITNGNIFKLLPGGGKPAALNVGSWTYDSKGMNNAPVDAIGKINNNLLSQTITLWLNMRTSGNLGNFIMTSTFTTAKVNCSNNSINYGDTKEFKVGTKFVNKTVNELYNLAIKALTNLLDKANDPALADISSTVDLINNAFDQGRCVITYLRSNAVEVKTMSRFIADSPEWVQLIQAYPNPFNEALTFTLTPRSNGQATLVLYDVSGQLIATVFDGELRAGEEQKILYRLPHAHGNQTIIFQFRQGVEAVQGKLLSY